jgi:hypothetical protein
VVIVMTKLSVLGENVSFDGDVGDLVHEGD